MQFSLVTVIAALSATASGWQITAWSGRGCRINVNAADEVYRKLASPSRGCYNFGQDMPGVSCSEVRPRAGGEQGCISGELFPRSVTVTGGCNFYGSPNCGGETDEGLWVMSSHDDVDRCIDFDYSRLMSFFCYGDEADASVVEPAV
ncbi:hypothetical protein FHETE_3902 [Fusarium heterosporum]|uniref:Uncharacterized protein n=1 Tax=Fusarium heterosporum TaxID=42747 RepID=A0A8H5TMD9_FUSHE|nr:hypothetical protein FHETE_3902 [Fusarium heterosporum]